MKKLILCMFILCCSFVFSAQGMGHTSQVPNRQASNEKSFYSKHGNSKIELINSNIQNTTLEVTIDEYELLEVMDMNNFYKINFNKGTPILKEGAPNLPKINTSIIIPDNSSMTVVVTDYDYLEINDINIIPSKGNFSREIDPQSVPYIFGEEYNQNQFYPSNLVELGEPYILRDLRGQGVIIHPIQYNPFTKVLRVYSNIKFNVESTYSLNKVKKNVLLRGSVP